MSRATPSCYVTRAQVRFGDVDAAGIVYYPRIFEYVHEAFEELWDVHVGRRYVQLLTGERLGFPLVHSDVDFRRPLRFGDRPAVRVTCFRVGRSSLGLRYVFALEDTVHVEARMTVVCVQLDTLEAVPIPDAYRTRFEAILEEA